MTDREKLAREWATSTLPRGDAKTLAAIEHILATTTPPTMEGVEWDDEEHYLAGANVTETHSVVMVRKDSDAHVWAIDPVLQACTWFYAKELTPNGKRYELREKPEVLKTLEDYKNAPDATLAASMHGEGYIHNETMSRWESTHGDWKNYAEMVSSSPSGRMVLRRGWGDEA